MPKDGYKAEKRIFYLLTHAKKNIKMTIYTFTNKKIAKALKIAAKKGVKIYIIADTKEAKYKYSVIPHLALIRNISVYLLSGKSFKSGKKAKMHVKSTIIDDKILITGSANYSYSAFYKNYEYIIINKDKSLLKAFCNFFKDIKKISVPYRYSSLDN
jgi:phosphatidylserine/phosphatidylglycerophosphate/cardiolipin synthase-like enzyme